MTDRTPEQMAEFLRGIDQACGGNGCEVGWEEDLAALANSFDQPGDGPLAYDEASGRMVRLLSCGMWKPYDGPAYCESWRFPGALEATDAE